MSLTLTDRVADAADVVLETLDVGRYYRLMETGVLPEGAPIELLDGLLIRKDRRDRKGDIMTIGTRHSSTVRTLVRRLGAFEARLPIVVQNQQPIQVDPHNEPEPDLSVLRGELADFVDHHAIPDEIELVVEVADSSLALDLGRKQELYREAGIREYWVVNLRDDVIEVFRGPRGESWDEHRRYARGETIESQLAGAAVQLAVDAILGPARS